MLIRPALKYGLYRYLLQHPPVQSAYQIVQRIAHLVIQSDPASRTHAIQTLGEAQVPDNFQKRMQQIEAEEVLDTFMLANRRSRVSVELHGVEVLKRLRQDRQKVILTTAHFGRYWPVGLGLFREGLVSQAVIKDRLDANIYGLPQAEFEFRRWKLQVMQDVFGCQFHTTDQHPRYLAHSLAEQPIISLFDVPVAPNTPKATIHPLFNQTIRMNPNPGRLAQIHDAYIVPFMNTQTDAAHLQYRFFEPIRARDFNLTELNTQLLAILMSQIKINPAAWWLWPALPHFLIETDEPTRHDTSPH